MAWHLDNRWQDLDALADAWRAAAPFPHLIVDDLVPAAALPELFAILDDEGVTRYEGELYAFDASTPEPATAELARVRDAFAAALAPVLARVTGRVVRRADMRAYAYRVGDYLLPHTDHQDGLARALAYAYYLPSPEPPVGGELELYRCALDGGAITRVESARVIEPRGNRLVIFEVGAGSLHQVREVLDGLRLSLAGWFYP